MPSTWSKTLASEIIDTFPEFLQYWQQVQNEPLDQQIEGWAEKYMAKWPELLEMQLSNYAEDGYVWRDVARKHVFPSLSDRLPVMRIARDGLLTLLEPLTRQAGHSLAIDLDMNYLIYVGIGCGAGWAAPYQEKPAILFGLENIAEEGWWQVNTLESLVAHELGHSVHFAWRAQAGLDNESGAWWNLYEEGFAQRCADTILGREDWCCFHSIDERVWLPWCQANKSWLAGEYRRLAAAGEPVNPFFGSWFDIEGRKQTGYFLGHQVICELEREYSLRAVACLSDIDCQVEQIVRMIENQA